MQFPEAPIPTPDERTNDALHEPFKRERFTRLEAFFGIGPGLQQRVAAIAILSAMIERQVELALWTLESERFRPGLQRIAAMLRTGSAS